MAQGMAPGGEFSAVISLPLTDTISIAVGYDGEGWRFFGWMDGDGRPLPTEPHPEERRQCFQSPTLALAYFRAAYTGQPAERLGRPRRPAQRLAS